MYGIKYTAYSKKSNKFEVKTKKIFFKKLFKMIKKCNFKVLKNVLKISWKRVIFLMQKIVGGRQVGNV